MYKRQDEEYVRKIRKLCDDRGILLIFDEVQTGMGRTGHLFAHQMYGVYPDIFTSAKALGGGIPIGAVCATEEVAAAFEPGDHGTTFGGNPFATAAGLSVFKIFESENLVKNANEMGVYFKEKLSGLKKKHSEKIMDVRGAGDVYKRQHISNREVPMFQADRNRDFVLPGRL